MWNDPALLNLEYINRVIYYRWCMSVYWVIPRAIATEQNLISMGQEEHKLMFFLNWYLQCACIPTSHVDVCRLDKNKKNLHGYFLYLHIPGL